VELSSQGVPPQVDVAVAELVPVFDWDVLQLIG
jgi:hypothetical protein